MRKELYSLSIVCVRKHEYVFCCRILRGRRRRLTKPYRQITHTAYIYIYALQQITKKNRII